MIKTNIKRTKITCRNKGHKLIFQLDNASSHIIKATKYGFNYSNIPLLDWAPRYQIVSLASFKSEIPSSYQKFRIVFFFI